MPFLGTPTYRSTITIGLVLFVTTLMMAACACQAVEKVTFHQDASNKEQPPRKVVGELLLEAQDGAIMLMADDGQIWIVQPDQLVKRESDDSPLVPLTDEEAAKRVLAELPRGFQAYHTTNYVVIHNTSESYAKLVGAQFEQLYRGFFTYWKNQRWELPEPKFPLIAVVMANRDDYIRYGMNDIGETAKSMIGYYHLTSNRLVTYKIPNLERNIATVIHEGTHQLAFNRGMQKRYADNPKWVSEGLATFFESPDMSSPRGWRGIGRVNQVNLRRWRAYLPNRPQESLATLLADDTRFNHAATAPNAYGEGWALTYFLIKTRRKEYTAYMQRLSDGQLLKTKSPRERIQIFEEEFGMTLTQTDKAFKAYMRRLR